MLSHVVSTSAVQEVLVSLGMSDVGLAIICDGSGTLADKSCGGFAAVYKAATGQTTEVMVGTTHGSNNFAELLPFVVAMSAARATGWLERGSIVACVSDSEYTVRAGQRQYSRDAHAALWAALDWYEEAFGVLFRWRHVRRNSNPVNERADAKAGEVRLAMTRLVAAEAKQSNDSRQKA